MYDRNKINCEYLRILVGASVNAFDGNDDGSFVGGAVAVSSIKQSGAQGMIYSVLNGIIVVYSKRRSY